MTDQGRVQATFAATLVDEWARLGVRHAVVCPGSRSTPLAVAVDADERIEVHVCLDERSGGFVALGIGRATGAPALVVTTSGTAAVELHPAIVEAHQALVPMLVCTADRPRRLWDVGAPQTIRQSQLYGGSVRRFVEPGVPDDSEAASWRPLALDTFAAATASVQPGPVHLNLELDEPLTGTAGPLPPTVERPSPGRDAETPTDLDLDVDLSRIRRGVLLAGGDHLGASAAPVHTIADELGWPVLADPRSGARTPVAGTIAAFDALLRVPSFVTAHDPDLVVQLGPLPASKVLSEWLAGLDGPRVVVDGHGRVLDPMGTAHQHVRATPTSVLRALADGAKPAEEAWRRSWEEAERAAQASIEGVLATERAPTEPAVARTLVAALPDDAQLVVSSSMPVRDVEWWSAPCAGLRVHSNRGANGIDGVVSTAIGVAAAGHRTAALVGDLAFLHDSSALVGLAGRDLDLTVVVVDNRGGGIFSFLPQARDLPADRFERLFGTPHDVDLVALARAHGVEPVEVTDLDRLAEVAASGGTRVAVVRTDRAANVELHARLHTAVARALTPRS